MKPWSSNTHDACEEKLKFSERLPESIARFGGTWLFIIPFFT